jgi:hypothetical protein
MEKLWSGIRQKYPGSATLLKQAIPTSNYHTEPFIVGNYLNKKAEFLIMLTNSNMFGVYRANIFVLAPDINIYIWLKVGSKFDRSSLKSEARRFSEKSVRPPHPARAFRGTVSRDLLLQVFFHESSYPQAPENSIQVISNFLENSQKYSQVMMHHRYQRYRQQILPPLPLMLLIPVKNLSPVSAILAANLATGVNDTGSKFGHWCQWAGKAFFWGFPQTIGRREKRRGWSEKFAFLRRHQRRRRIFCPSSRWWSTWSAICLEVRARRPRLTESRYL